LGAPEGNNEKIAKGFRYMFVLYTGDIIVHGHEFWYGIHPRVVKALGKGTLLSEDGNMK
jgi:hypothetical protein